MHVHRHAATRPQAFGLAQDDVVEIDGQQLGRCVAGRRAGPRSSRSSTRRCISVTSASPSGFAGLPIRFVLGRQVHLEAGAQRRERALQLVRRVGDETTLPVGGVVESREHPVHRPREAADLVVRTGFGHPAVQIRLPDRGHLGADRLHRSQRPARDPPRHERDDPTSRGRPIPSSVARCSVASLAVSRLSPAYTVRSTGRRVDGLRTIRNRPSRSPYRTCADDDSGGVGARRSRSFAAEVLARGNHTPVASTTCVNASSSLAAVSVGGSAPLSREGGDVCRPVASAALDSPDHRALLQYEEQDRRRSPAPRSRRTSRLRSFGLERLRTTYASTSTRYPACRTVWIVAR